MNMNTNHWVKIIVLVVIAAAAIYLIPRKAQSPQNQGNNNQTATVTDFDSCVAAGYPVMESYPPQCTTPDGKHFIQPIVEAAEVVVESPVRGQIVTSPLTVKGVARGTWYFEANLPVTLKDSNGNVLAQKGFQAKSEWMTTDFVPFEDTLTFSQPQTEFGLLVIERDNPSGLPEFDKSFIVQVRFR